MGASMQYKQSITANDAIMQTVRRAGFTAVSRAELRTAPSVWLVYTPDAPKQDAHYRVLNTVQAKLADVGLMLRGYGEDGRGRYLVVETGIVDLKEKAK